MVPGVVDRSSLEGLASCVERALAAIQRGFFNQHTAEGKHQWLSGTWTPIDLSGAGLELTSLDTTWVRAGQIVYLTFRITYPTTADGSENAIGGLPFACIQTLGNSPVWASALAITTDTTNANSVNVGPGTKTLVITDFGGGGATNAQLSTDTIQGMLVYRTSEP